MLVAAAALGVVIGLSLGALGGGGGVLVVPALVYLLGQSAQDATTSSVIIVGLTATTGALARLRGGCVDWRSGLGFGAVGIPAAYLGAVLAHRVDGPVLLLAFSALTLVAAVAMLINSHGHGPDEADHPESAGPAATGGAGTVLAVGAERRTGRRLALLTAKVVPCGFAIGFLTGFLGVGGGFLIVPVLVIVLRMPMALAVGTSLMIMSLNSAASFVSRLGVGDIDWRVIVPFTVAAIIGSVAGKKIADRLSGAALTRAFGVLLLAVGGFVALESLGVL